jgi:hypothetical protein
MRAVVEPGTFKRALPAARVVAELATGLRAGRAVARDRLAGRSGP